MNTPWRDEDLLAGRTPNQPACHDGNACDERAETGLCAHAAVEHRARFGLGEFAKVRADQERLTQNRRANTEAFDAWVVRLAALSPVPNLYPNLHYVAPLGAMTATDFDLSDVGTEPDDPQCASCGLRLESCDRANAIGIGIAMAGRACFDCRCAPDDPEAAAQAFARIGAAQGWRP